MSLDRSSGILLHPSSLSGPFGIGDLGPEAHRFVDFLSAAGQELWQVMPLGPTGYGDSPYQSESAFAGNTLLISPERLVEDGVLSRDDVGEPPRSSPERVEFRAVAAFKRRLLRRAYERATSERHAWQAFEGFREHAQHWLPDYALFVALKEAHGGAAWNAWEPALARREAGALASARQALADQVVEQEFAQYLFFSQWAGLRAHCALKGVRLIGDVPIFVAHDSADVWVHPDLFKLDPDGRPTAVAGVPPDLFSETGQLWGNPVYDWERARATGYAWWIERVRAVLAMVDLARIDHFRGFAAYWEVPAGASTAEAGAWVEGPGEPLFEALRAELGSLPLFAEDLGTITPDVEALRQAVGLPSMRVLQFAFDGSSDNLHLPHTYDRNIVVYTGTHDNDTTVGWFSGPPRDGTTRSVAQVDAERRHCLQYLHTDGKEIHWDFIRTAFASVARIAIAPIQDVLGLNSSARMNTPASKGGNWGWRLEPGMLTGAVAHRLRELSLLYGRTGAAAPPL